MTDGKRTSGKNLKPDLAMKWTIAKPFIAVRARRVI